MTPTAQDIKLILDQARSNPADICWIEHGLCVGDTAAIIATALNQRGQNLDAEQMRTLGYLHDIGKMGGNFSFLGHALSGYAWCKRRKFPDHYCEVCLTHSFIKNDPNFTVSSPIFEPDKLPSVEYMQSLTDIIPDGDGVKFLTDFVTNHQFTLEDKIISFCDLVCLDTPATLEKTDH